MIAYWFREDQGPPRWQNQYGVLFDPAKDVISHAANLSKEVGVGHRCFSHHRGN